MSAIFDFAAEYDLSAALTELRVAIRLRDGRGRNEDCSPCPTQINIVSIAAMHTPLPQWVISTDPNRPRARAYVCTTPESYRNLADYWRSMMRLTSRSKSKSEVSGQSGHCSARLLAALRAITRPEQSQQIASLFDDLIGAGEERDRYSEPRAATQPQCRRAV